MKTHPVLIQSMHVQPPHLSRQTKLVDPQKLFQFGCRVTWQVEDKTASGEVLVFFPYAESMFVWVEEYAKHPNPPHDISKGKPGKLYRVYVSQVLTASPCL